MRTAAGWFAKGGAEGLLCAGGPDGLGVALKSEDGAGRPLGPALAAFLGRFGVDLPGPRAQRRSRSLAASRRRDRGYDFVTPELFFTNL